MTVVQRSVASIPELVATVLEVRGDLGEDALLWFRGVSCEEHTLLPKLLRDGKNLTAVQERERRLLTRFRQRGIAYWPAGYPQDNWEHLFAMQHYGMPTRLLDWSENLFVAAYFALSSTNQHDHAGSACVPTIWCLEPVLWNRATPALSDGDDVRVLTTADEELDGYGPYPERKPAKPPVAIFGTHNSDRIVAQRGTFVLWGEAMDALESVAAQRAQPLLWRISLTGDRAALSRDLQILGFSETMVFPELGVLASELVRTEGWR